MGTLDGVVALVTGAAQGIGKAAAVRLAEDGARVAVNARVDDERLAAALAAAGHDAIGAPCDILDWEASRAMVAKVEAELGPIEVLVANAARMTMKPFLEQEPERVVAAGRREPHRTHRRDHRGAAGDAHGSAAAGS